MDKVARQELIAATRAYEAALGRQASVPTEVQRAFDNEVLPKMIRPILENCQKEVQQTMRGISRGQFPKPQYSYGVLRHMPMSMREDQFLHEMMSAYVQWEGRRLLKQVIQAASV